MKKIYALVFFALITFHASAQLTGYSYAKPITVYNTATVAAVNYQLKLTINTQSLIGASQMQTDGDDIRFGKTCNGTNLYNHWLESGINTPTTTIWVKIDSIPAGGNRTFYFFHGNSSAVSASSIPLVFFGVKSATDSVATGAAGGAANSQRGFRFSPNEDILVTSFGKREPNGTTRYVTLFDNSSTGIIAQIQVSGPAATYSYAPLVNPIWLTQGTQYVLQLYQGASDGYYYGTSSQINSKLTYYDMRYCNSCTQNTFPTQVLSNYHYGYPDLQFYWKNNITPSPTYSIGLSALPSVSATTSNTLICVGQSATLTASGANSYSWSPSGSGVSIVVTPTVTTSYTVIGTSTVTGCLNTGLVTQNVSACTGITAAEAIANTLNVYPNPNNGEFAIELNNDSQILVYDVIGKVVYSQKLKKGIDTIHLPENAKGVYFLKVVCDTKEIITKIVVN